MTCRSRGRMLQKAGWPCGDKSRCSWRRAEEARPSPQRAARCRQLRGLLLVKAARASMRRARRAPAATPATRSLRRPRAHSTRRGSGGGTCGLAGVRLTHSTASTMHESPHLAVAVESEDEGARPVVLAIRSGGTEQQGGDVGGVAPPRVEGELGVDDPAIRAAQRLHNVREPWRSRRGRTVFSAHASYG